MQAHEFIEISIQGGFGQDAPPVQLDGYKLVAISAAYNAAPKLEVCIIQFCCTAGAQC